MRPSSIGFFVLFISALSAVFGQPTVPTVSRPISNQSLVAAGPAVMIDLRNFIGVPGLTASAEIVQFTTYAGRFNVQLRRDAAPRHVENFLGYVRDNAYANTFIHRAASFDNSTPSILQGGGYRVVGESVSEIPRRPPVPLEYSLPNERGTLAAARTTDINSATIEWYFNVRDNSTILNQANGGGYTVFGRVLGTGLNVLDQIATLPRFTVRDSPFTDLPLRGYTAGQTILPSVHLATVNNVAAVTLFPTGGAASVIDFTVQNSAPAVAGTTLSGSTLTVTPLAGGRADIVVRAIDTNGNSTQTSFNVEVTAVPPAFVSQPASQTVAAGSTLVLRAAATSATSYQWKRNDTEIPGATSATLLIPNASGADAGRYVSTAINSFGVATSDPATIQVAAFAETDGGRLANLSVLTSAGAGARALTMGTVIGPAASSSSLPLLVRAVGPGLQQFGVGGVLADPTMVFNAVGVSQPVGSNDNWQGTTELQDAFRTVGAFPLPVDSLDAALVRPAPGLAAGEYTVQVTGKGNATGSVLAEMYDAAAGSRTANTPRLVNLSVLKQVEAGEALTVGFVIRGESSRTVLVRAIGPGLEPFGLGDRMADPALVLYNGQTKIAENDNWAGDLHLMSLGQSVGAFPTSSLGRDAMLVLSLPRGDYSATVSDLAGAGGNVIVEVYEIR